MSKQELERIDDLGMAAWDNHKPDAFADLFADEFVLRDMTVPEPLQTDAALAPASGLRSRTQLTGGVPDKPGGLVWGLVELGDQTSYGFRRSRV